MCGFIIAWGSKLYPTIALFTIEAEYVALCVATYQGVMFLRNLLTELFISMKHPSSIMEDNKSCISYASNLMTTSKSKHINVKLHFVRDAIRDKIIVMQWCSTCDMNVDILIKFVLPGHQYSRLAFKMMFGQFVLKQSFKTKYINRES